nr:PREDICTED: ATP-binding cassette sub-family B member 8, mitochondrial-like [Equus przewalskii]
MDSSGRGTTKVGWAWGRLWPHTKRLFPTPQLALGAALVNVQIPLLLGQLVEIVAKYTRDHVGSFLTESRNLSTHLLILYGIQGLLTFGYLVLLSRIGERMAVDMRRALFSNLLRQDIAFFDAKKTGQLVSRLTTDVQEFKSSFKLVISQVSALGPPVHTHMHTHTQTCSPVQYTGPALSHPAGGLQPRLTPK